MSCWSRVVSLLLVGGIGLPALALQSNDQTESLPPQATSLLGKPLVPSRPAAELVTKLEQFRREFDASPDDPDRLIWYARFLAYCGHYQQAIDVFSRGIEQFPDDPRMLRHRAHRYITLRQFDKAVSDLDRAILLIDGQPNQIEPDGMPNAQNTPVSSLHGNIWYHKGLAHYLMNDMPAALNAFQQCCALKTNDDNTVSATHWIYMILRRMDRPSDADKALSVIRDDMNIIENFSYHRACLFYQGKLTLDDLKNDKSADPPTPADDSLHYAIGNWYLYNDQPEAAMKSFRTLIDDGTWASFGHIAAEADLARMLSAPDKNHH